MGGLLRRHSLLILAVLLLLSSFQLMSASIANPALPQLGARWVTAIVSPIAKTFHELQQSTRYVWTHYVYLQGVEAERNELLQRLQDLEKQNSTFLEYAHENERLRKLVKFTESTGYEGIAATVIGRDPSNWSKTITIDRGSEDRIRRGMPVVDGHAVVGQVIVASRRSARVLLLTDSASAVDALFQKSRATGVVEGTSRERLRVQYVLKESRVKVGDRVIASGLDRIYPKGTLIGVVTDVKASTSGMFQRVHVKPSAHLDRLETVLVLTEKPLPPPKEETLAVSSLPSAPGAKSSGEVAAPVAPALATQTQAKKPR